MIIGTPQNIKYKKIYELEELESSNTGTFTNFAQNDQELAALHYYFTYLKFGFGRATQDAGIEIRRGSMNRDQAKNLVKLYDGHFPEIYFENYLNYFSMSKNKFFQIIDKHVNKKYLKVKGIWKLNYKNFNAKKQENINYRLWINQRHYKIIKNSQFQKMSKFLVSKKQIPNKINNFQSAIKFDPEIIIISTTTNLHLKYVKLIEKYFENKKVLIEKPLFKNQSKITNKKK